MEYLTLTLVYFFLFLIVFCLSKNFKWIDVPDKRKIHKYPIYNTGGLIIYFFYLIVVSQYELNNNIELNQEEIEMLLQLIKASNFSGDMIEKVYNVTYKLQVLHSKLNQ